MKLGSSQVHAPVQQHSYVEVFSQYFHAYLGSGHFFGFKILNFIIFWGFQKNRYFWGIKILWIFFGVITKLDYI